MPEGLGVGGVTQWLLVALQIVNSPETPASSQPRGQGLNVVSLPLDNFISAHLQCFLFICFLSKTFIQCIFYARH